MTRDERLLLALILILIAISTLGAGVHFVWIGCLIGAVWVWPARRA